MTSVPPHPYEWLYAREARPLKAYVLDEVAARLADAVERFPPAIEAWESDALRLRLEPLLRPGRPRVAIVRLALKLYRWDIGRAFEETDRYMRGEHWREYVHEGSELELALFLWRYWMEQTMAFKEYAQDKFRRAELVGLADRLEARLVAQAPREGRSS
jgi:hypothetical protein